MEASTLGDGVEGIGVLSYAFMSPSKPCFSVMDEEQEEGLRYELQVCGSCINVEKDEDEEDDRSVFCVFAVPFNSKEKSRVDEVDNGERPNPNNLIYKICFGESSYLKAEDACS